MSYACEKYSSIVTLEEDFTRILRTPTLPIAEKEWAVVEPTAQKLLYVRNEILKGGAGLAAPQIGLSYPVFIYTPDRTAENLRVAINPAFEPLNDFQVEGYEACFSVPLCCTKLKRWKKIKVTYQTLEKENREEILEDFAAKVFQHEMDHLNGRLTIDHQTAEVLTFTEKHAFQAYMQQVHLEDSKGYSKNPLQMT